MRIRSCVILSLLAACAAAPKASSAAVPQAKLEIKAGTPVADLPGEKHFRNVRKLTKIGRAHV